MSDIRETLARQLADVIQREVDPHLIDNYRENLEKAAAAILAEFLVVPRSEVAIETSWFGTWGTDGVATRQRETWTGQWSSIPLPEDGER